MKRYIVKRVYQVVQVENGEWTIVDQFSSQEKANNMANIANEELASRQQLAKEVV